MFKKIMNLIALVSMCISMAAVASEPAKQSEPIILSQTEMDQITAGFAAYVDAAAAGDSPFMSFTGTETFAFTMANNLDNPPLGGLFAISGGEAQAVAVGDGSSTTTSVQPANNLTGASIFSRQIDVHAQGQHVEINASVSLSIGSLFLNP